MQSPTGLIPENLYFPEKAAEVMRFVMAQPWPGTFKRSVLAGWSVTVGCKLTAEDYATVERSGVDGGTRAAG